MADASLKSLLVKLKISTADWQKYVKDLKANLKEMQEQSLKDFQARAQAQVKEMDLTKQQIADQKRLRAEAEALAAVDKAKAEWHRQQTEAIRTQTAETQKLTAEAKKQSFEKIDLLRTEKEKIRLQQLQLKLQEQQTAEIQKQKLEEAKLPSIAGVSAVRASVTTVTQPEAIAKIQTEALRQIIIEEKAKLSVQEAQLKILAAQEGTRKADVDVVQREVTQERARLSLLESQLRMRENEQAVLRKQREEASRIPSAVGVSGLRTSTVEATQLSLAREETLQIEKQIVEERAKLNVREAQLKIMSTQEGVRKVDVEEVQKEITQERSKLALLESQLRVRQLQSKEEQQEQERLAKIPSTAGVSGLRAGVKGAAELQLTKEQTVQIEKQISEERAKLNVQEAQLRIMSMQEGARKADVEILEKEIAQERARLSVQEAQVRMAKTQAGAGGEGGGGNFIGGALLSLGGGLFGGGLPGMMMAGVAAGQLLEKMLEKVGEAVRDVGKEMLNAAGPAGELREQFQKLASREGVDPEEFLNRLRVATRGLIDDNALLVKTANNFMQGPLKLQAPQIERLTELTIALARAQGTDATEAMNALSRAALTGYTRQLSWTLGLARSEMSVRNLGKGVSETDRQLLQLHMTMDAMERKFAEVGTPMTTVADLFKQLHMVQNAFAEDMAYGLTHSTAFAKAIQTVSKWLQDVTPRILDFALGIGEKLGNAFGEVEPILSSFWNLIKGLGSDLGDIYKSLNKIADALTTLDGDVDKSNSKVTLWTATVGLVTIAVGGLSAAFQQAAASARLMFELVADAKHWDKMKADVKAYNDEVRNIANQFNETRFKALGGVPNAGGQVDVGKAGTHTDKPVVDQAGINERRKLQLQIAQEDAKSRLEIKKQEIEAEQEMEKEKYERGLIDLQQYMARERDLEDQSHNAKLEEIKQERDAKLANLKQEAATQGTKDPVTGKMVGGMDPGVRALKEEQIRKQATLQAEAEETAHQKRLSGIVRQGLSDQEAAQREYAAAVNKIQKQGVAEQTKVLEDQFRTGELTADAYLEQRRALIQEGFQLTQKALDMEADANKKNGQEVAKIRIQMVEAEIEKEKELQDLEMKESEIRLQAIQTRYSEAREILQAGVDLNQAQTGIVGGGTQTADLTALRDITTRYIQQLQGEQDKLEVSGQKYSEDWANISKRISEAAKEQIKLNTEIAKAHDLAGPLGQIFGTIASELSDVLGPKTAAWFTNMAKTLDTLSKVQTGIAAQMGGMGGLFKGTGTSFLNLFRHTTTKHEDVQTAQQIFENGLKSAADKTGDFAKKITAAADSLSIGITTETTKFNTVIDSAVQQMTKFVQAAQTAAENLANVGSGKASPDQSQESPDYNMRPSVPGETVNVTGTPVEVPLQTEGQDAAGGLQEFTGWLKKATTQGDAFADKLKEFMGALGGVISSIGGVVKAIAGAQSTGGGILSGGMQGMMTGAQFGGPWGAVAGAAIGAALGGLVGSKVQAFHQEMASIQTRLDGIKAQLQSGTTTMGAAISQLQQVRSQLGAQLMHAGGSGKKFGNLLGNFGKGKQMTAQLKEMLAAVNSELAQLLDQQKAVLQELSNQLGILLEPKQYQDILNSLDQIIAKYQEFASAAAGNSAAMAEANQWLVVSLQAYAQTMANDVRQANEQAISDKEHLLDLQQQLNQESLQEYDILTQGVQTRERTTAMTKGTEIARVEYEKKQTQSEYDLQDYKVKAESKMFDLANDRLGLEKQMVALQEQDFDLQMKQVMAMQKTLAQLQAALGAGGTLPAGLLNATGGVNIQSLEQLLGLPITATGPAGVGQPYIQNEPPIFQEFIDTIDKNTSFKNFGADLLAAAATPTGSSQRKALVGDLSANNWEIATALETAGLIAKPVHGKSQDPNWLNFFSWIMNQAQAVNPQTTQGSVPTPTLPSLPGMALGGMPPGGGTDTVPAMLTPGEYVIPADIFSKFITALSTAADKFGNFVSRPFGGGLTNPITPGIVMNNNGPMNNGLLDTHQQIFDLATSRIAMETNLVKMQRDTIAMDMQRIQALTDLSRNNYRSSGVQSLEGSLAKVYELRGRMGLGGFTRENL